MEDADENDVLRSGENVSAMRIKVLIQQAQDSAEYTQWTVEWVDLSPTDYGALERHAESFARLAQQMRDIITSTRSGVGR